MNWHRYFDPEVIAGIMIFGGFALMVLCSIFVRFIHPEVDNRYKTGYKDNDEVSDSIVKGVMYVLFTGVVLIILGLVVVINWVDWWT